MHLKSLLCFLCLLSTVRCQNFSSLMLSNPSSYSAVLPIIPDDFRITPQGGATVGVPIAQCFHLLLSVVFKSWNDGPTKPQPSTVSIEDGSFRFRFQLRFNSNSTPENRTSKALAWAAGRILEREADAMTLDQPTWRIPKTGYAINSNGKEIARALLIFQSSSSDDLGPDYNITAHGSSSTPPFLSPSQQNSSTTNLTAREALELRYNDLDGSQAPRKAIILLLLEYLYGYVFAMEPSITFAAIERAGRRVYGSEALYGTYLKSYLTRTKALGRELVANDVGQVISILVATLARRQVWKNFTVGAEWVRDPGVFMLLEVGLVDGGKGGIAVS